MRAAASDNASQARQPCIDLPMGAAWRLMRSIASIVGSVGGCSSLTGAAKVCFLRTFGAAVDSCPYRCCAADDLQGS